MSKELKEKKSKSVRYKIKNNPPFKKKRINFFVEKTLDIKNLIKIKHHNLK